MKRVTYVLVAVSLLLLSRAAMSQDSSSDLRPNDRRTSELAATDEDELKTDGEGSQVAAATVGAGTRPVALEETADGSATDRRQNVIASLTIFVLAVFVGFEVITKVPPTLHTPLMSGSNAISGITLVGAIMVASGTNFTSLIGCLAVTLATINAVGGFLVTHRMLVMFTKK